MHQGLLYPVLTLSTLRNWLSPLIACRLHSHADAYALQHQDHTVSLRWLADPLHVTMLGSCVLPPLKHSAKVEA